MVVDPRSIPHDSCHSFFCSYSSSSYTLPSPSPHCSIPFAISRVVKPLSLPQATVFGNAEYSATTSGGRQQGSGGSGSSGGGRSSVNLGGTALAALNRGNQTSFGGTAIDSNRGKKRAKQFSRTSARPDANDPVLEDIIVSRVDFHDNEGGGIVQGGSNSNGGGKSGGGGGATDNNRSFRSAPSPPERSSFAVDKGSGRSIALGPTVRKLLVAEDGLKNLCASLQNDDADGDNPEGAAASARAAVRRAMGRSDQLVTMARPESVARSVDQVAAGLEVSEPRGNNRPRSAPPRSSIAKKASVFGSLVHSLVETNVRFIYVRETPRLTQILTLTLTPSKTRSKQLKTRGLVLLGANFRSHPP